LEEESDVGTGADNRVNEGMCEYNLYNTGQ